MSNSVIVKSIYATLGTMITDTESIVEALNQHAETTRSQDLSAIELVTSDLERLFTQVGERAKENELRMIQLGIAGNSQYQRLINKLPEGSTRNAFKERVDKLESLIVGAKQLIEEREMVVSSQLSILKGVVGEMQLEINV
ncbi:hypothetical protein F7U66_00785 [Vibrio parahaemolyticus]|nr:hypothetical protein [Vibrio parahaemolyticus]